MTAMDFALGTLGSEQLMSANDATLGHSIDDIAKEKRLAGGALVRYKILKINKWQWAYSWIWGKRQYVYDGGQSRDDLFSLYLADSAMSYLVPSDQGVQLTYTVRFSVNSWKEQLIYRNGDMVAWRLNFELVQVS